MRRKVGFENGFGVDFANGSRMETVVMDVLAGLGLSEVRLHPSPDCRAWIYNHGCVGVLDWERGLERIGGIRGWTEEARLRISAVLGREGVDPLGITRKLLIHESSVSISRGWVRETGFVHLEAASGIHLYALWRAFDSVLSRIAAHLRGRTAFVQIARVAVPIALWIFLLAMTGFRPGLLRPLVLVGLRWCARTYGFRWARPVPILAALGFDALLAMGLTHGRPPDFGDWAPGELHYALSWWGGILGYEWAKARQIGRFGSHAALSVASWVAVLPLDWLEGRFSLWTPLFSLLTVEFLASGGFAAMLGLAAWVGWAPAEGGFAGFSRSALQWVSIFWNEGIGELAVLATRLDGLRELSSPWSGVIAGWLAVFVVMLSFRGHSHRFFPRKADL